VRHLLTATDLQRETATALLDTAEALKQALLGREVRKLPTLRGRTVVTLFYESSTRTRASFEIAGKWMSADVVNVSAAASSVAKGESLRDTALTLAAMGADCVVIRHPASGAAHRLAGWVPAHVINAGDGTHQHPTQALLDAATLRERLGTLNGRTVTIVGDILHSRVARSNIELLITLGARIHLVAPPTLLPCGVENWEFANLDVKKGSGQGQEPRLSEARLGLLPEHAVVLHPGPMLRGMEIAHSVADSPRAAITDQVRNGVHVRMAVLYHLLAGQEEPV
jgi:aspartate carbamoyltransferase catalytic subunit